MMKSWVGRHWLTGRTVSVSVDDQGKIASIEEMPDIVSEQWISPGLMDIQVNGIQGVDYNNQTTTVEQIQASVKYLHSCGVVRFCPTVTTCTHEHALHRIHRLIEACEQDTLTNYAVIGIHIEGPYISEEEGPRGAHSLQIVRDPNWEEFLEWNKVAKGRICKVTLAPERKGAIAFIRKLVENGIVAAIGHTSATEAEIQQAVEAGATMSTHLGNGAHAMIRRHPNYIWSQMAEDRLWAGLIPDGYHLPPSTLKCMIRVKGNKAILVSDTNSLEGAPAGTYARQGIDVIKTPDGVLRLASNPDLLAGSAIALNRGIENIARFGISTISDAIAMATINVASMLGLDQDKTGQLEVSAPADLILYTSDEQHPFQITETIVQGETVYRKYDL